jgi:hypothetical protein
MPEIFCRKTTVFSTMRKVISTVLVLTFSVFTVVGPAGSQIIVGQTIGLTPVFIPPVLKGMSVHAENPLLFDFIVDRGQNKINNAQLKDESTRLIKYFFAAMTISDKDAWVNLSPYEKDRIIPEALGQTEMGRQMLEQDYILKQMAASLTNPDTELGRKYWDEVHRLEALNAQYSTMENQRSISTPLRGGGDGHSIQSPSLVKEGVGGVLPTNDQRLIPNDRARNVRGSAEPSVARPLTPNNLNKVWIIPDSATVVEKDGFAYITESKLNVMLDEEYQIMTKDTVIATEGSPFGASKSSPTNLTSSNALIGDPQSKKGFPLKTRGNDSGDNIAASSGLESSSLVKEGAGRVLSSSVQRPTTNDQRLTPNPESLTPSISTQVFRKLILPKLIEEVNTGKSFAPTRQVYQSVILAAWYKKALKDSLLGRIYADKNKVAGVETDVKDIKEKVYEQYVEAFKKGAYNVIKEELDSEGDLIPRKYFSGGQVMSLASSALNIVGDARSLAGVSREVDSAGNQLALIAASGVETKDEAAMQLGNNSFYQFNIKQGIQGGLIEVVETVADAYSHISKLSMFNSRVLFPMGGKLLRYVFALPRENGEVVRILDTGAGSGFAVSQMADIAKEQSVPVKFETGGLTPFSPNYLWASGMSGVRLKELIYKYIKENSNSSLLGLKEYIQDIMGDQQFEKFMNSPQYVPVKSVSTFEDIPIKDAVSWAISQPHIPVPLRLAISLQEEGYDVFRHIDSNLAPQQIIGRFAKSSAKMSAGQHLIYDSLGGLYYTFKNAASRTEIQETWESVRRLLHPQGIIFFTASDAIASALEDAPEDFIVVKMVADERSSVLVFYKNSRHYRGLMSILPGNKYSTKHNEISVIISDADDFVNQFIAASISTAQGGNDRDNLIIPRGGSASSGVDYGQLPSDLRATTWTMDVRDFIDFSQAEGYGYYKFGFGLSDGFLYHVDDASSGESISAVRTQISILRILNFESDAHGRVPEIVAQGNIRKPLRVRMDLKDLGYDIQNFLKNDYQTTQQHIVSLGKWMAGVPARAKTFWDELTLDKMSRLYRSDYWYEQFAQASSSRPLLGGLVGITSIKDSLKKLKDGDVSRLRQNESFTQRASDVTINIVGFVEC